MASIYEIDQEILACIDEETGEILDAKRLDALQMAREKKLENVACWVKNLLADADAIKAERRQLEEREKAARNKAERLKQYLVENLRGDKLNTARAVVSYRKSEQVRIVDEDIFVIWAAENHNELLRYEPPSIRLNDVKAYLKTVGELPGAEIVEKQNVIIK